MPAPSRVLSQALFLIEILQGLDQFAQLAGNDGIELVKVQVNPVIGHPILWKIISADPLATVTGAYESPALEGALLVQLLLLHLVEPATQDAQGALVVLMLATLILALHFQAGGQVPDAHGALGLIDV